MFNQQSSSNVVLNVYKYSRIIIKLNCNVITVLQTNVIVWATELQCNIELSYSPREQEIK